MATRPRLTRAEQQAQTRDALLDAAADVFVERGFHGASIEAICARAGYTPGAYYGNFDSKEELFAELLQQRGFALYRRIAADSTDVEGRPTSRQIGERLAKIVHGDDMAWAVRLFLELLAHAGRDDDFRHIAAGFWTGTRAMGAQAIRTAYDEAGEEPPVSPEDLATAMIALDVGLSLQHFVDPEAVRLQAFPELFDLLFGGLEPSRPSSA